MSRRLTAEGASERVGEPAKNFFDSPFRRYALSPFRFFTHSPLRPFADSPFRCIASAVLYVLAFPNFNLSWLAWVALAPLALAAYDLEPGAAFRQGWLAGSLAYSGLLYWIVVTFKAAHQSLFLALPCLALLSAYLGLFWGAWAWSLARVGYSEKLRGRYNSMLYPFFAAASWVALEYLRTYLFSGFPWTLLADSQTQHLFLIQMASVTGVYGVSFVLAAMNASIAVCIRERSLKTFGLTLTLTLFVLLFGMHRLQSAPMLPPAHTFKVALLQGNIDQYKKWDKAYVEEVKDTYEALALQAASQKPALIIWPETSVPGYLLQEADLREWMEALVQKTHTSHLLGSPSMDGKNAYNTSFSLNPKGKIEGEYEKQHLVPFGEVVPWAGFLGRYIRVLNELGGFTAGTRPPVLKAGGQLAGVNICYEAIFPNLVRTSVKKGARFIVNLTNDGWYMQTAAPYQHFAPNVFRAVENRRWLARADNTGISAIIDPYGRVTASTPIFQTTALVGDIQPLTILTFYTRYGDVFAILCCVFAVLLL